MPVSEVWELDLACRQAQGGRGVSELPAEEQRWGAGLTGPGGGETPGRDRVGMGQQAWL